LFLSSRKYDPKYSSQNRIPDPDLDFLSIPDPGVKKAPDLDPKQCKDIEIDQQREQILVQDSAYRGAHIGRLAL